MRHGARLAALAELTDSLLAEWQQSPRPLPVEQLFRRYVRDRRYIGSKDRRWLQDGLYRLLRRFGELRYRIEQTGSPVSGRNLVLLLSLLEGESLEALASSCSEGGYGLSPLTFTEQQQLQDCLRQQPDAAALINLPAWLHARLSRQYGAETEELAAALQQPAPVDIRVNSRRASPAQVLKELQAAEIEAQPIPDLPFGITVSQGTDLSRLPLCQLGAFEIQDRGSQAVMEDLAELPLPTRIIDLCAGAGGKSLALAARWPKTDILACDADAARLSRMKERLQRAKVTNISLQPGNSSAIRQSMPPADLVVVDAPCSGTGTIRRHPDLPWRLRESDMVDYVTLQRQILSDAAALVQPGGHLLYITCSLLAEENESQLEWFQKVNAQFTLVSKPQIWSNPVNDMTLRHYLPNRHQSDGFFSVLLGKTE